MIGRFALAHPYLTAFVVVPALVSGVVEIAHVVRGSESPARKAARELADALDAVRKKGEKGEPS